MDILSQLENRRCYLCGAADDGRSGLCPDCQKAVIHSSQKKGLLCPGCSQPQLMGEPESCPFCKSYSGMEHIYSISYFSSYMKELLTLYKSGQRPGFRYFFGSLVYDYLREKELLNVCIVPIPPRRGKMRSQGWDQVDLLCRTLSSEYGLTILRILEREDQVQQKTLNFEERKKHMKNVLRLNRGRTQLCRYEKILLIDDILTSGATISAARELLTQDFRGELLSLVLCSVL